MKIAIDIDFIVVKNDCFMYKLANRLQDVFNESIFRNRHKPIRIDENIYLKPSFLNKLFLFNNKYFKQIKGAKDAINELHKNNAIYFVSSRGNLPWIKYLTMQNIEGNGIPFDAIFINCNRKDKFVNENDIDLFIDDSIYHCENVATHTNAQCICFNKKSSENSNVLCLENWNDILEYVKYVYPIINSKNTMSDEYLNAIRQNYKRYTEERGSTNKFKNDGTALHVDEDVRI